MNMEDKVFDVSNREIEIGDIVVRAKFSSQVFHKVLGITSRSLVLSCSREQTRWSARPIMRDAICLEDVEKHYSRTYYSKTYSNRGILIIKKHNEENTESKTNDS